jgi:hypothetical protein
MPHIEEESGHARVSKGTKATRAAGITPFWTPCDERQILNLREVKLGGFYRDAGRGPSGSPRTPRSRSLRETIAAAGRAPSP